MNPENTKSHPQETLTRRQKLLRRAVPLALLASGVGGYVAHEAAQDSPAAHAEAFASAGASSSGSVAFESGGGWGYEAAEHLLKRLIREGAANVYAGTQANSIETDSSMSADELDKIVEDLPTYEKADELLKMAGYEDKIPDAGDKLSATVFVEVDSDKKITYSITDAEITDLVNNR